MGLIRNKMLALALGALLSGAAGAELTPAAAALDDLTLDSLRGGFLVEGIEISIGLEQIVSIDGETQVINQLFIPNLNSLTPGVSQIITDRVGTQVEVSNSSLQGLGVLTHIQNTLDNRVIQNLHSLNIELSNIGRLNAITPLLDDHFLQSPGH